MVSPDSRYGVIDSQNTPEKVYAHPLRLHIHINISNSHTMGCPLYVEIFTSFSEWTILRTDGQTWYTYFIPPASVLTLHIMRCFVLKLVSVVKIKFTVTVFKSGTICASNKFMVSWVWLVHVCRVL